MPISPFLRLKFVNCQYCWQNATNSRLFCSIVSRDLTCKHGSIGQSEGWSILRSSIRFRLKPENSNSHGFQLNRSSIKGAKLILKVTKAIIIILRQASLCLACIASTWGDATSHLLHWWAWWIYTWHLGPPEQKEWQERAKGKKDWWRQGSGVRTQRSLLLHWSLPHVARGE